MTTMYTPDHEWINIEDHVAQRVLRVVRDADDRGFVVLDVDPLVVGGVHRRHGRCSWVRCERNGVWKSKLPRTEPAAPGRRGAAPAGG